MYLITRRCTQRLFLLKPSPLNTQIFAYCLAVAVKKTGMLVHAIVVLSNHVVLTDPEGRLPKFTAHLHKLVAKCVNASLGRWENVWSSEKPCAVTLEKAKDVMVEVAYTACNPVAAGLVAKAEQWLGLIAFGPGQRIAAKRPEVFFRKDGDMEATVELTLTMPPQYTHLSAEEYTAQLSFEIASEERKIHEKMEQSGRSFMGMR